MDVQVGNVVSYAAGKTGVVRYIGETEFAAGEWVGIELERPEGKNNGELNGRVYFTCLPNHGLFIRRSQIKAVLSEPTGASSATVSSTASRLQQLRDRRLSSGIAADRRLSSVSDRRLSGVGTTASTVKQPTSATGVRTPLSTRSSTTASPVSRSSIPTGSAAPLKRTSYTSGSSTGAAGSRLSLDAGGSTRRASISRTPSNSSDDQLIEAKAQIARLEEELEQKNRHVEQLKQSVAVMKEAQQAAPVAEEDVDQTMEPMDVDEEDQSTESHQQHDESAQLIEQIETVKLEAEEHVRAVRAELEEHISQLQAEHDELVDELRLENATQASEIKSLEAEINQQKSRIAQFTAAEQKKAEEVAHAVAKTSTEARKVETLEAQVTELQDMVEMMTLEKETLEMDKEIAEERVEECLQEIEKLKASLALSSVAPDRADSTLLSSDDLAVENKKLRAAVKALHERGAEDKAELTKKLRQMQRENTELAALREEVEQLTTKRNTLESEAEELKEMLDVANAYESMVEDLTEKNLSLGEKVAELEATVQSLESLHEMEEEMEHQHNEYEAELRDEIETQRVTVQELKQTISEQKTVIDDKDRTIARFRDLAHGHREEINQLKAQLRAESGELASLKGTAHSALNQTMSLRALAAAARENEAEAAKQKINAEQARLENSFLRAAVPTSIFSEMDQKVLRVRLRLGRIAGKSDILLQYLRKDLEAVLQQEEKEDTGAGTIDFNRAIQQLLLGEKLAAVSCQAKEDLFMLECHLTTKEEFVQGCSQLDTAQVGSLETALDSGLNAFADGTLLAESGETSVYNRLVTTLDEWYSGRSTAGTSSEGFPVRCAVVKLRSRKNVVSMAFSLSMILTFVRAAKNFLTASENSLSPEFVSSLVPKVHTCTEELLGILNVAHHLHRRSEIDLAASDDDLDGLIAVGGDVVELTQAYSSECQSMWVVVQEQLSIARLQEHSSEELDSFVQQSFLGVLNSFKERLASLYKLVCRGAFTDAVAPRSRERTDDSNSVMSDGRPQWQIRAQAIHAELLHASTLRARLNESNELCQTLHARIRELERSDSQYRVVTQKLESEVLRLTDSLGQVSNEKTQLEEQLAREREQFGVAMEESHKEKTALDALSRELRKQLKRFSDTGNISSTRASSSGKSSISHGDAEAFHKAFDHLHKDLQHVRATLARERLDHALGGMVARTSRLANSNPSARVISARLEQSLRDVSKFSRDVKVKLAMPRLVDLSHPSLPAQDQFVTSNLARTKVQKTLEELKSRISTIAKEDGWSSDVVEAISRGESVFGWHPPEMERPPVLLGRVKLGGSSAIATTTPAIRLVLNRSDVQQLTQTLVC